MKRAHVEMKTPDQAAQQYFLPKHYYDPAYKDEIPVPVTDQKNEGSDQQTKTVQVPNYLKGMDVVAVLPDAIPTDPTKPINQLATPVFQLLDQRTPEFAFADAVQTNNEILGRNTWMLWCGGNEGFWDWLATDSLGFIDLLRLIDSRGRAHRFRDGGLINEPGMAQNGMPDEFGVWLDVANDADTANWRREYLTSAFAAINDRKRESQRGLFDEPYPNAPSPTRGYSMPSEAGTARAPADYGQRYQQDDAAKYPPPGIYGVSSGVVGLRLFPNPYFDAEARKKWDAQRYYSDEDYWADPKLIRPYRVGVACVYCYASFHPLNPPARASSTTARAVPACAGAPWHHIRLQTPLPLPQRILRLATLMDPHRPNLTTHFFNADSPNGAESCRLVFARQFAKHTNSFLGMKHLESNLMQLIR